MQRAQRLLGHLCHANDGLFPSGQMSLMDDDAKLADQLKPTRMKITDVKTYTIAHLDDIVGHRLPRYKCDGLNRTRYASTQQNVTPCVPVEDEEEEVVLVDIARRDSSSQHARAFVRGGSRAYTVWKDKEVVAAVVTCGGLCPGLNDVTRELFFALHYNFGVDTIYGIRNGLRGFYDPVVGKKSWVPLTLAEVADIHTRGGTYLGSSRGGFDVDRILNACVEHGVNQVYITGGDGTHRAAHAIADEIARRKLRIAVVAIPKTIDNDIGLIDRSFGFNTAIERAQEAIVSAQVEASCTPNGIGIVKLMGRDSGFIAAHATMASRLVDICLIPEVGFDMHGDHGVLAFVEKVLAHKGYAVIVLAEGAAKHLVDPNTGARDASNNLILPDVGDYFKRALRQYFTGKEHPTVTIKYHDPSYMIRSCRATASDAIYCLTVAQNAVYGAMAGYTNFSACLVNNRSVYIPLKLIDVSSPVFVNPNGRTWMRVVSSTQQPNFSTKK